MSDPPLSEQPAPWSLRPKKLGLRAVTALGAGSVIAAFYIGTGDVSVATSMGAQFGFSLWWTYFVLGIAGWALIDMAVRYFLQFGKSPMSIFKDVHPIFSVYMFVAIVVCSLFGSYSQWNACAMVISGFFPGVPIEAGGSLAALGALVFLLTGAYKSLQRLFIFGLLALIVCFFASALAAGLPWREAAMGLIPNAPGKGWFPLFMSNAGSIINAWLILIYPYTMIERGMFSRDLQTKVDILHRARIDYAWGILAAGIVALPIMAAAAAVARPFGIVPRSYMDLSILLEPIAGAASTHLFLAGLFLAAWHYQEIAHHCGFALFVQFDRVVFFQSLQRQFDQADSPVDNASSGRDDSLGLQTPQHRPGDFGRVRQVGEPSLVHDHPRVYNTLAQFCLKIAGHLVHVGSQRKRLTFGGVICGVTWKRQAWIR